MNDMRPPMVVGLDDPAHVRSRIDEDASTPSQVARATDLQEDRHD